MCNAHAYAPVLVSPSTLKALRERGIKGERVPFPPPKCAICPLTLPEQLYYYLPSSNTDPTISRRNQNTQGSPRDPPERTQRPSPSQRPCSRGTRHKRKAPSPHLTGSRVPFPQHPSGDGRSIKTLTGMSPPGTLPNGVLCVGRSRCATRAYKEPRLCRAIHSGLTALGKSPPSFLSEIPIHPATAARKRSPPLRVAQRKLVVEVAPWRVPLAYLPH